jgi:1-acyl-sn-glycerol-3-phosphate acyltransferase
LRWFLGYVHGYLRRNFRAVRLLGAAPPSPPSGEPMVVVLNHPSWWDPLVGLWLTQLFPEREHYAPIESAALAKYRFFERLGFFGIEPGTTAGGLAFLRAATAILSRAGTAVWITGQGQFCDVRERPVRLRPGIAHLARRLDGGCIVPLALEYPFWNERYPEALARFGTPIAIGRGADRSVADWLARIEAGVTTAQEELAAAAMKRDPARFRTLVGGSVGVGGVYDAWRRLRGLVTGRRCDVGHDSAAPSDLGGEQR